MKKLLAAVLSLLAMVALLSVTSLASTVKFEEDYIAEGDFVIAAFNGAKPFFENGENVEPIEDACFWVGDYASRYNIKYVSFLGDITSGANYTYSNTVAKGMTWEEMVALNNSDEEWIAEFELIKSTANILSDAHLPYGISIGRTDYLASGLERQNHIQTVFSMYDYVGDTGLPFEEYDNNNFAIVVEAGDEKYIIYQLEAYPRQSVINWFDKLQVKHADKRAIVMTTSLLDNNGNMYTQHDWNENWASEKIGEAANPNFYANFTSTVMSNILNDDKPREGNQLWKEISKWDNVLLVVTGNATPGQKIVTSKLTNDNGNEVLAVVSSLYGGYAASGNAYPVLIKISADNKTIDLRYAVPYYDKVGGYIDESKVVIELNALGTLEETDPANLLSKVDLQLNGSNTAYINGYANDIFKPNANMTKAEACTIIARLLTDGNVPTGNTTKFTDVKEGDWYYDAIAYLDNQGYFFNNNSTTYSPNAKITRAEFVELAYFASELDAENEITFSDVTESHKYYDAIQAAANSGLIDGYADGTFKPDATITRAEVVTIINRMLSLLANEKTVSESHLEKKFTDIDGHWAKYQILMAANNNVHGDYFYDVDISKIQENKNSIFFENDYVKVAISKKNGKVTQIVNKATGENVNAISTTPWFSWLISNSGAAIQPLNVELADGRIIFTYKNMMKVAYLIDVQDDYFSVTLDTNLSSDVLGAVICNLQVNSDFAVNSENSFSISGVSMTTTVNNHVSPGGLAKYARGTTYTDLGVSTLGTKLGVAYSNTLLHRDHLKSIIDDIDPAVGITSTHGGPYAYDNEDIFYDYVILSSGLYTDNAVETAQIAKKYSVEQIDLHQGGPFIQADFNFLSSAGTADEKKEGVFIDAATFRERIAEPMKAEGVQLSLHTYSSLVAERATKILSNPKWQKQICLNETTYTLEGNLSKFRKNIRTYEDASDFQKSSSTMPSDTLYSRYILIDEEIILVQQGTTSGFLNVQRGQLGTIPTEHVDGATIYQLMGWYSMFQSKPFSELFYHIAEETAKTINDGGFEMVYLDGIESFGNTYLENRLIYYGYAEFVHTVLINCNEPPVMEFSQFNSVLWAARGRGGANDYPRRAYKGYTDNHVKQLQNYLSYFYTGTLGWIDFAPDAYNRYSNVDIVTMFKDDIDYMGAAAIAYDFSNVNAEFSLANMKAQTRLADNFYYYTMYSQLRKARYFSEEVKEILKNGEYEYKLFRQEDGSWAFREMQYIKNRVYHMENNVFATGTGENKFETQNPFIRIEQYYSTSSENTMVVKEFDETAPVASLAQAYTLPEINVSGHRVFKIKVYGNGSENGGILLMLNEPATSETGRHEIFIPLNFTGWKEFIIAENHAGEYAPGFTFFEARPDSYGYPTFRNYINYGYLTNLRVMVTGDVEGAFIDDLVACPRVEAPVDNPSVTINGQTITFNTEFKSGEFIEYYPEDNKAYLNYYEQIFDEDGYWLRKEAHVKEIAFTGAVTVPAGAFEFTYKATPQTSVPTRARVTIGLAGGVIENPEDWIEPEVDIPDDVGKIALY